jgi:hypothetical protein
MTERPCPENTLCVNTLGGYDCSTCLDGFSPDDGGQCTGIAFCKAEKLPFLS